MDYAASLGDVVIHKAYCNWQFFGKYQTQLNTAGLDLIQIFPRGWNAKNGADISLALDALTDIQQQPHITHVIIISNDTDFVSLALKVKQSGRSIVGIGLPEANRYWQSSCNEFKQYQALVKLAADPVPVPTTAVNTEASKPTASESPHMRPTPLELAHATLIKGLRQMLERSDENYFAKTALKTLMKRLDPAFDERGLGFGSFTEFLRNFPDIVNNIDSQHLAMVVRHDTFELLQELTIDQTEPAAQAITIEQEETPVALLGPPDSRPLLLATDSIALPAKGYKIS